eukprot:1835147-Rhodomonas_salina.2
MHRNTKRQKIQTETEQCKASAAVSPAICPTSLQVCAVGEGAHGAREVMAGALAVELARAEVDVAGAVAVHPALRLKAVGAGVA